MGGEGVSEPEEGGLACLEAGDPGSGELGSSNEKKRDSVLELCWLGGIPLGRPPVSSGRLGWGPLGRGSLCGTSPVA